MKRIFFIIWAILLSLIVLTGLLLWLLQTTVGAKTTLGLVNSLAPVNIEYSQLNGSISSLKLNDVHLQSNAFDLSADQLTIDWNPFRALLAQNIQVDKLTATQVSLSPKPGTTTTSNTTNMDWRLPFQVEVKSAEIDHLLIETLSAEPFNNISLALQLDKAEWTISHFSMVHALLNAELSGRLRPFDTFEHSLASKLTTSQTGSGTLKAEGDRSDSKITLDLPDHKANLNAQLLDWLSKPTIKFSADIDTSDLAGIAAKFEVTGNGDMNTGELSLDGTINDQDIKVNSLNYQRNGSEVSITSKGIFSEGPFSLQALVSPEKISNGILQWTPVIPGSKLLVKSSRTQVNGPWSDLMITVDADGKLNSYNSRLALSAALQEFNNLQLAPSTLSVLGGSITLSGSAQVNAPQEFSLNGTLNNLRLADLDKRLPMLNNGRFTVAGKIENNKPAFSASFNELNANIEGRPLTGMGQLDFADSTVNKAELLIEASKDNRFELSLLDPKSQTLQVNSNINDLGALIAGSEGKVSGIMTVKLKEALLSGQLDARSIVLTDLLSIDQLSIRASQVDNAQTINISGDNLLVQNNTIEQLKLDLKGKPQLHSLTAEINAGSDRVLSLHGIGKWLDQEYHLNADSVNAEAPELGLIKNEEAMQLTYSAKETKLLPFCLCAEGAQLCGELNKGDTLTGKFDLLLQGDKNKIFKQQISTISFKPQAETKISANFDIGEDTINALELSASLPKLSIFNQDNESLDVENINLQAKGINNHIDVQFDSKVAGGNLAMQGNLSGQFSDPVFEGLVTGNLPNLEAISPLLITTDIKEGNLQIKMQVTGKMKSPGVIGFTTVNNTKITIPELGVTQSLNAEIRMLDLQNGTIKGTINSGEGKGDINGEIKWIDQPLVNIKLSGEKLLIADSDSLSISASPDLTLEYAPGKLDITGNINIDRALSNLAIAAGSSQLSNDIVFINEDGETENTSQAQLRNIDISTVFVNPARIDGHGIRGDVTGKLRITQKDSGPILGNGQLNITGEYKAFGQLLKIETGRLNYVNTALENPSIDFYATRQIDDVIVGVKVTGRPNALVSRLESTPSMREADILNYLVLGKAPGAATEMDSDRLAQAAIALALSRSESGIQAAGGKAGLADISLTQELGGLALSLGKQLSPRLYIGYTMGFIEPVNVARIRYMLSSKWVLESEIAGETRAIIKYRFEKD